VVGVAARAAPNDSQITLELLAARSIFPDVENPRSVKDRYKFHCPLPGHANDRNPSFWVHSDGIQWKCFPCGEGGGPRKLLELLGGDPIPRTPQPPKPPKKATKEETVINGCPLAELAEARNLPLDFLTSLGWHDSRPREARGNVVATIPWPGGLHYRVNLDDGPKYKWKTGSHVSILGLDRLEEVRRGGWAIFVEGDTDYAAGLLMDLPVMALPGASTFKAEWALQFQGCQVYVWQEPGKGGETFVKTLGEAFWDVQVIAAPPGVKDLCELHDQAGDGAREFFDELKAEARRWRQVQLPKSGSTTLNPNLFQGQRPRRKKGRNKTQEPYLEALTAPHPGIDDHTSFGTFTDGALTFYCNKFGFVLKSYLADLKDKLLAFLKETGDGERYERTAHCWEFYRELVCQTTERSYLARFHCGERGCSLCGIWAIQHFFEEKEAVLAQLEKPAVYRVILGSECIGPFPQDKERQIKKLYTRVRGMVTHLSDNGTLKDFLYGVRARIQGRIISVEVDLLTPYARELESQLQEHFSRETGVRAYVQRIPCDDRREAQRAMANLMAVPIVWETNEDYEVWRKATKGMKLIQGKGMFYKVAGGTGKAKAREAGTTSPCPICRKCAPVVKPGFHNVDTTQSREVVSDLTGETYIERVVNSPPS
jgi:hypothetical protein